MSTTLQCQKKDKSSPPLKVILRRLSAALRRQVHRTGGEVCSKEGALGGDVRRGARPRPDRRVSLAESHKARGESRDKMKWQRESTSSTKNLEKIKLC